MIILGIETSCDETGAALIKGSAPDKPVTLLSNSLATSLDLHAKTGGIIPEQAAREQLKVILPVIDDAIKDSTKDEIDAIAVTHGPGLIGSLLVGVETAKTLSYIWKKPLIPVNHLYGHIYANFIRDESEELPELPALALVVSGGHTDLVLMKNHSEVTVIGSTRDDAAGEAFDKIGRLIGLSYPAGAKIAKHAKNGNPEIFDLPRPMKHAENFDFSFSGLKTAAVNQVKKIETITDTIRDDLCAAVENAIVDVLVHKTVQAAKKFEVTSVLLGGGVAANEKLQKTLTNKANEVLPKTKIFVPSKNLCTDNAAMIAAAAFYKPNQKSLHEILVNPNLYY